MIIRGKALLTLGVLLVGALLAGAAPTANSAHYVVNEDFTNTGFDSDARGHVKALVKQRGQSHLQRLRVTVAKLDPSTPYQLLATTGDDTNFLIVAAFTTTRAGRAVIQQQRHEVRDQVRPAAKRFVMAEPLAPLTEVRTLAVADTNGVVILTLDLHAAPSLEFALTSVLQNTGADFTAVGCVAVALQNGYLQFRMFATGQGGQFKLLVNDSPVGTYAADFAGRVNVGLLPPSAPSPLKFRHLALQNADDEVVLESIVP
jgi:hypothetical protein